MKAKICGITTLSDAEYALAQGADFIGMIFHKPSKRYVEPEKAKEIIQKLKKHEQQIVGVFLDEPIQQIAQIAKELDLKWVQFLAPKTKEELSPLRNLKLILVLQVDAAGSYDPLDYTFENGFVLYDGIKSGSGEPFNWAKFNPKEHCPFFIAGGLSASTVETVFKRFEPDGVDVASKVSFPGKVTKDPERVREFIQKAHDAI